MIRHLGCACVTALLLLYTSFQKALAFPFNLDSCRLLTWVAETNL